MTPWQRLEAELLNGERNIADLTYEEYLNQSAATIQWCIIQLLKDMTKRLDAMAEKVNNLNEESQGGYDA